MPSDFDIDYSTVGFAAGSCFADYVAARMARVKLPMVSNPMGVMFNPLSLAAMLDILHSGRRFEAGDLTRSGDMWFSYLSHGNLSSCDRDRTLELLNNAVERGGEALRKARYVILTFGTAWVYSLASNGEVVANCHKQPSSVFVRSRIDVARIVEAFEPLMRGMLADKRVIFTVSPVRHIKDGLSENSLGKAVLRVAVGEMVDKFDNACYFPAYEILNDDLRDYRFYADDLVHPSDMAVDYVWEKFSSAFMSENTLELAGRVGKIVRASEHRLMNPESAQSRSFLASEYDACRKLMAEHPEINLYDEMRHFAPRQ